ESPLRPDAGAVLFAFLVGDPGDVGVGELQAPASGLVADEVAHLEGRETHLAGDLHELVLAEPRVATVTMSLIASAADRRRRGRHRRRRGGSPPPPGWPAGAGRPAACS